MLLNVAAQQALDALEELAEHPAFADTAPEFNAGGIGYEAIRALKKCIKPETSRKWLIACQRRDIVVTDRIILDLPYDTMTASRLEDVENYLSKRLNHPTRVINFALLSEED